MKLNPYDKFEDVETRRCQLVYLKHCKNETWEKISEITNYAISTVKNYVKKFADLLEKAMELFDKRRCAPKVEGKQLCYLVKFYDSKGKIIFSKIGTTTRDINTRIKEHLVYYTEKVKRPFDIKSYKLESLIDCGEIPAEGLESDIRSKFIKKFPREFIKNDRFFGIELSVEEFNLMAKNYLG